MANGMDEPPVERVSVSLAQLRAELAGLELRLVDRLHNALNAKADVSQLIAVDSKAASNENRITVLEHTVVTGDSPIVTKIEMLEEEMGGLREINKYRKWLWAQTIALISMSIPIAIYVFDHLST